MKQKINIENIPNELKLEPRWVLWKKKIDGSKMPLNPNNLKGAKVNDSKTWSTFDKALAVAQETDECEGLGFVLGGGYFGVDIDNHDDRDPNAMNVLFNEFISVLNSYAEITPSGKGIHILCKGHLPAGGRRKGNIEMYDDLRFFTVTGNMLGNCTTVEERTFEITDLYNKYLGNTQSPIAKKIIAEPVEPTNPVAEYIYVNNKMYATTILNDNEIIMKAVNSKNGNLFNCLFYGKWQGLYNSQSEADMAFCMLLAFWTRKNPEQMDRIFRSSNLYRDKWNEMRGTDTYGNITIAQAIANCKEVYDPEKAKKIFEVRTGKYAYDKKYDLTDTGNAEAFIDKFGSSVCYNFDNKQWMIYNGKYWKNDSTQEIKLLADQLINDMKLELAEIEDEYYSKAKAANIKRLASSAGKEAMLKEAMHLPNVPKQNRDFDREAFALNCESGIISLKSGKLFPHDKERMISKSTHIEYAPDHEPKKWLKFLNEIFLEDQELITYVQKAVGYSLTGTNKEQVYFQCYGDGANGKSVFFDIIRDILGDYGMNIEPKSLLSAANVSTGNASPDIARMSSARFVQMNEPDKKSRFKEGLMKKIVAGDPVTARFLYGNDFEFKPKLKLWIATNYKIGIEAANKAVWRRNVLIPFKANFEGREDKDLTEKLKEELPQILGWAVKGCIMWQKQGLGAPQIIKEENTKYREEMDSVKQFCNACVREIEKGIISNKEAHERYKQWCKENEVEIILTSRQFCSEMSRRYEKKRLSSGIYYLGITLDILDESYTYEKELV